MLVKMCSALFFVVKLLGSFVDDGVSSFDCFGWFFNFLGAVAIPFMWMVRVALFFKFDQTTVRSSKCRAGRQVDLSDKRKANSAPQL